MKPLKPLLTNITNEMYDNFQPTEYSRYDEIQDKFRIFANSKQEFINLVDTYGKNKTLVQFKLF